MADAHMLIAWMFITTDHPTLLIALAALRVLGAVVLLLAAKVARTQAEGGCFWTAVLSAALYSLALLQLIGALAMEIPGAPLPSGWIFLFNSTVAVIGLGLYFRHIYAIRQPDGACARG